MKSLSSMLERKFPIGPEITSEGVQFRVYAPLCQQVEVVLENQANSPFSLIPEGNGYFSGLIQGIGKNTLYRFRLDGQPELYPDPASPYQPEGPFGPSQVIDQQEFIWKDAEWRGMGIEGQIIYEMHLGTYTPEGTFQAAIKELEELVDLGITTVELMPLADFPGKFGWGYDGVNLFAPCRLYGTPNDLKAFINRAHELKLAVILDIVYNHFGPSGNFIHKFSDSYFLEEDTEWGKAINFEHPSTQEFYLTNAAYWVENFHFDGFRVDAIQGFKSYTLLKHLRGEIAKRMGEKKFVLIGEDEPQDARLLRSAEKGGYGFDALWNDDFHHAARVCLTGSREAYFADYTGTAQELLSCLKYGFLFQGQYYTWQKKNRGRPCLDIKPQSFVTFIQNHDQIGNHPHGMRIHKLCDTNNFRAMTTLFLLAPGTPLIFQGQEFAASTPFYYMADHEDELKDIIHEGRKEFLSQFPFATSKEVQDMIPHPAAWETFQKSKLKLSERQEHREIYQLYKDLIHLRKTDEIFSSLETCIDGIIFNDRAFLIRYFGEKGERLLLVNFGMDLELNPMPHPLIAPPEDCDWEFLFSTEATKYGGAGIYSFREPCWKLNSHSATVLKSTKVEP